jgi:hypothetical protein
MIKPLKIIAFCIPLILPGHRGATADVRFSAQGCNNRYGKNWVMTASPEIALTWRWFGIGLDGSVAAYTPSDAPQNYSLRTRVSFFPLLRIPLRNFFLETGYGVAQMFRRDEIEDQEGSTKFESGQSIHGELRASAGLAIPLGGATRMILRGGLGQQDKENRFFFASLGIGFGTPAAGPGPRGGIPSSVSIETAGLKMDSRSAAYSHLSVVSGEDAISTELRTAVEAALIQDGFQVTSWDKIRNAVQDDFLSQAKAANPKAVFTPSFMDSLTSLQIAFRGTRVLQLDAIVETDIRYVYKAYGEDIIVQSASLRLTEAATGRVIWVTEYDSPDTSFPGCRQKLIKDLVAAMRR